MSRLDHFTRQAPAYLLLFALAFTLYLVATFVVWKHDSSNVVVLLVVIFALGLSFRIPLWTTTPTLSADVWRYLWDGRLMVSGVNPYANWVDAEALDYLATPVRDRIDHAWMASPYPPLAETVFAGVYAFSPDNPAGMQVFFTVFDFAAALVVVLLLRRLRKSPSRVILYLWNPLIIVEFAHGAHVDSLMSFLMLLAIYWSISGKQTRSAIALAAAILTKVFPAVLLPVFMRRWGVWRTMLCALMVLLVYLPFLSAGLGLEADFDGTGVFGAARIYAAQWKTNDGLFYWMTQFLEMYAHNPETIAKVIAISLMAIAWSWVFSKSSSKALEEDPGGIITHSVLLISLMMLLSAAMFPWYLAWLIALLPLFFERENIARQIFIICWIYFSAAVNLYYLAYLDPTNPRELHWVRLVEYLPLFVSLIGAGLVYLRQGARKGIFAAD